MNIWIASIYYEARYGEQNVSELRVISDPAFSLFNTANFPTGMCQSCHPHSLLILIFGGSRPRWQLGEDSSKQSLLVRARRSQGPNRSLDGLSPTKLEAKTGLSSRDFRSIKCSAEATQANFIQGAFESLAAKAFPAALQAVTSKGLKAVDATGLIAFGLTQSGLWDVFKNKTNDYMKHNLGHPLHQFSTNQLNISPEELRDEQEEFEQTLDAAQKKVQASGLNLSNEQAITVAELMTALSLGILEDVPEEPKINLPK